MLLEQEQKERLVDFVDEYVFGLLESTASEGTFDDVQSIRAKAKAELSKWLSEDVDPMDDELANDSVVLEDLVDAILDEFEAELAEAEDEDDDEDSDSEDDSKEKEECDEGDDPNCDDDDCEKDECNEANLVKHKISKIQSVLDKRKRKTDPKWKMSRRRTLMKIAARGGRVVNRKISKAVKRSYRQGFGKRWEDEVLDFSVSDILTEADGKDEDDIVKKEDDCDCGKDDCEVCNPKDDSKEESTKTKREFASKEKRESEDDDDNEDCDGESVKPEGKAVKKITKAAKAQKEAVKESLQDAFQGIEAFGTLSEDDSAALTEKFTSIFMETFDRAVDTVADSLMREFDEYRVSVLMPEYNEKVEQYIAEEILPKMESDVNNYLDYIVNEQIDSIMESGRVYKSRESIQLEEFRDSLLELISDKLQLMPEQEDALIAMENKNEQLASKLHEARVARARANQKLLEMENTLWVERNLPSDLSEAGEEKLRGLLEDVEAETHDGFVAKAKKIIESFEEAPADKAELSENNQSEKSSDMSSDIVGRTLAFMRKK